MRRLVLGVLLLAACSSEPERKPETPAQRRARCERRLIESGDKDWRAFLELGELDEAEGDLERAVSDYGAAVALVPARRITRPAVSLGRAHLKRGRWDAARRLFDEVLLTVPSDPALYRENPDYREAALGLGTVFEHAPDPRAEEEVRRRFLEELGGKEREWPK